jgi:predicted 2-oxoglutarate/Fe(II)-dependent dioxygenase YbiX
MEMFWRVYKVADLPVICMDNFYDDEELNKILPELFFLTRSSEKMDTAEILGSAKDGDGNVLKKTKGYWLDSYFSDRKNSDILEANRKIFQSEIIEELLKNHIIYEYITKCNFDSTLVQYYENEDGYKMHNDSAIFSFVTTFYQSPKKFEGGDFEFLNGPKIECVHNRAIIFPSILRHRVTPIKMNINDQNKNFGRFSITQFIKIQ